MSHTEVLLYHAVPRIIYSSDILEAGELQVASLYQGRLIDILVEPDESSYQITLNDYAHVTWYPDQIGANGVIHPLDQILVPEQEFHTLLRAANGPDSQTSMDDLEAFLSVFLK